MTPPEASYRTIPLTQNQTTVVDAANYEWLSQWKWHAHWDKHNQSFYAVRRTTINGKRGRVFMHRLILGLQSGDKRQGDHRSRNTLDNRQHNLRISTSAQNTQNSKLRSDNWTGCKGVHPLTNSKRNRWYATIGENGTKHYLGSFDTKAEAIEAYKKAALRYHGEFAAFE